MALFALVLAFFFASLVLQYLLPPVEFLNHARIILTPVFLSYVALAFELPYVLAFSLIAGFVWDGLTTQFIPREGGLAVEIWLGWSIVLYGVLGSLMHGMRPWFQRGKWYLHPLLSGLSASAVVLVEYLMISLQRMEETHLFVFPGSLWIRILGHGLICFAAAFPFCLIFTLAAKRLNFDIVPEESRGRI